VSTTTSDEAARGAGLDRGELSAWRGFLRAHSNLTRALDAELLERHGISLTAYEVLLYLADSPTGRLRMSELADSVLLSRSGLTRLIDRLERDGLAEREDCEADARGLNAVITPRGRRRFEAARKTHLSGVRARYLDLLSRAEQRALSDLWRRLGAPG
jgi:DNA-binding MarR family transcriptional regulator